MRINKYYIDCLFGPMWNKEYIINKEDLSHYIELNLTPQPTSYVKYSDKEELLELNPEYTDYIEKVFNQNIQFNINTIDAINELHKDIDFSSIYSQV